MSNDVCKPQRESQITAEFNVLEKVQVNLSDQISQLEDRLTPAMRDPNPLGKDGEEETSLVLTANRIRSCRHKAEEHLSKIENILDRLEL